MLQKQPEHMGASLHVFQRDVWDLNVGREIAFHDLSSGDEIRKPLPPADCIVSNLPFVQFEDVEEANRPSSTTPSTARCSRSPATRSSATTSRTSTNWCGSAGRGDRCR